MEAAVVKFDIFAKTWFKRGRRHINYVAAMTWRTKAATKSARRMLLRLARIEFQLFIGKSALIATGAPTRNGSCRLSVRRIGDVTASCRDSKKRRGEGIDESLEGDTGLPWDGNCRETCTHVQARILKISHKIAENHRTRGCKRYPARRRTLPGNECISEAPWKPDYSSRWIIVYDRPESDYVYRRGSFPFI